METEKDLQTVEESAIILEAEAILKEAFEESSEPKDLYPFNSRAYLDPEDFAA